MNKIKKHWNTILIVLLIIFSLNKCTVACNRDTTISKQETEIIQKDSIIKAQEDSLSILKIRWNDAQKSQSTYQGIAIGNQQSLLNEIESLNNEINALKIHNNKLIKENNQLKHKSNK